MGTKQLMAVVVAAGALACGGCATKTGTGALIGGGAGAGIGAAIGSATGNTGAGAAIGSVVGAVTGGAIGNAADAADAEDREKRDIRQANAVAAAHAQARMGIAEVVSMVTNGHSETVIINQIRSSGSTFQLTASDLDYLKASNVPDRVIIEMQNAKSAAPVIISPRPRGGVVYADPPPTVVVYERRPPPPPVVFVGGHYRHGHGHRW